MRYNRLTVFEESNQNGPMDLAAAQLARAYLASN